MNHIRRLRSFTNSRTHSQRPASASPAMTAPISSERRHERRREPGRLAPAARRAACNKTSDTHRRRFHRQGSGSKKARSMRSRIRSIGSDMGPAAAQRIIAGFAERRFERGAGDEAVRTALAEEIARVPEATRAPPRSRRRPKPRIVLVVGVNGSGKTTTIGKLAARLASAGMKVVIGAGRHLPRGRIEQLEVWAEARRRPSISKGAGRRRGRCRLRGCAARAKAIGADVALIDTAGRLAEQGRTDGRAAENRPRAAQARRGRPPRALLVLDATMGQNALSAVEASVPRRSHRPRR